MGAWETGVYDDDTTCDVRDDFIDYLDEGKTAEEATRLIIDEYLDEFDMDEDVEVMSLVFIGLSAIQMKKNCLREEVRNHALHLIDRGADLELWEEADERDFNERKKVLSELKQQLMDYLPENK